MLSLALIDSDVPRRNVTLEPSRSSIQCAAIQTPIIGVSVFQIWKRHFHAWIWLLLIGKCRFLIWILRFQIWKCHFHAWIWLFLIGKCRFHACDQIPPWVLLQSALFHAQVPGLPKAGRR